MCGGGGGSAGEIKETADQRAVMEIALERFADYENNFVPLENEYFESVDNIDSANSKALALGDARGSAGHGFDTAIDTAQYEMAAQGINPSSGRYLETMGKSYREKANVLATSANRTSQQVTDNKILGNKNIVAMGNQQSTEALSSLTESASEIAELANDRAINVHNERAGTMDAVGTGAGMVYRGYEERRSNS